MKFKPFVKGALVAAVITALLTPGWVVDVEAAKPIYPPQKQEQQKKKQPARPQQRRPAGQRPAGQRPRPAQRPAGQRPVGQRPRPAQRPTVQKPRPGQRPPGPRPGQRPGIRRHHGPRRDMHRPPAPPPGYRRPPAPPPPPGYRRPPGPPPRYWHHRPHYRRAPYRGYYRGKRHDNVLAALLLAGIIHSADKIVNVTNVTSGSEMASFIPTEAIRYKGHHYHVFSDIGSSMDDAQQFCESMGGHLATVGDDAKNQRMFSLINSSGYDNEAFEIPGQSRWIAGEPVTYEKVYPEEASSEEYYGMYFWNYEGVDDKTTGNAFVCEWDF